MAKSRLVKATERFGRCMILVHLQEDLRRFYQCYGHLNAAAEAHDTLIESRGRLIAALAELDRAQREMEQEG